MAPPRGRRQKTSQSRYFLVTKITSRLWAFKKEYVNREFLNRIFFDPNLIWISAVLLFIGLFINTINLSF